MDTDSFARAHIDALAISAYCSARRRGRIRSQEPLLATNPQIAYLYSLKVLKARFAEAEETIATSPEWAVRYARFVLKGRFRRAEKTISESPMWAYEYALNVVKGRLPGRMHRLLESMRGDSYADKYMAFQIETSRPSD